MFAAPKSSQHIASVLKPHTKVCHKKALQYMCVKNAVKDRASLAVLLSRPLTLIPYTSFAHLVSEHTVFKTQLPGDKEPEQTFTVKDAFVGKSGKRALVVGVMGEIYHADVNSKFVQIRESRVATWHIPIPETRSYVIVNTALFKTIADILGASPSRTTTLRIPTSWGATHLLKVGDALIVEDQGVYRIQGAVFKKTYNNTNNNA
jgi:hypothetical protein